jgi:hypothetical protein
VELCTQLVVAFINLTSLRPLDAVASAMKRTPGMGAEVILVLVEDCNDKREKVSRGTAVPPLALSMVSRYVGVYDDAAADGRAEVVYCKYGQPLR